MSVQSPPTRRCHLKLLPVKPDHVPLVAVSTLPRRAVPLIDGGALLTGGLNAAIDAGALVFEAEPLASEAVTSTWTWVFASAATSVYVASVAPGMSAGGLPPAMRCHW